MLHPNVQQYDPFSRLTSPRAVQGQRRLEAHTTAKVEHSKCSSKCVSQNQRSEFTGAVAQNSSTVNPDNLIVKENESVESVKKDAWNSPIIFFFFTNLKHNPVQSRSDYSLPWWCNEQQSTAVEQRFHLTTAQWLQHIRENCLRELYTQRSSLQGCWKY